MNKDILTYKTDEFGTRRWYKNGESVGFDYEGSHHVVFTDEGEGVSCPRCGFEEITYSNGIYHCDACNAVFTKKEIDESVGAGWHVS